MLNIIVAVSLNQAIGKNNQLLWHLPADLKNFKQLTLHHPIIMGRKTFDSIGKPLPHRTNIVITSKFAAQIKSKFPDVICCKDFETAVNEAKLINEEIFVIGGAAVYQKAIPLSNKIYLTKVHANFEADTFFPTLDNKEWKIISEIKYFSDEQHAYDFDFCIYQKTLK